MHVFVSDVTYNGRYAFEPSLVGGIPTLASFSKNLIQKMWSPPALHAIDNMVATWKGVLANTSFPGLPIWLSETNSICSGGVNNISNTWANTLWLVNQLGVVARAGIPMMAQQTLIGEDYGLLAGVGDRAQRGGWVQNVTARPNFYATLLHRQLCGSKVLSSTPTKSSSRGVGGIKSSPGDADDVVGDIAGGGDGNSGDSEALAASRVSVHSFCTPQPAATRNSTASYGMETPAAGAVTVVLTNFATESTMFDMAASGVPGATHVFSIYGLPAALPDSPSDADLLQLITSQYTYLNGGPTPLTIDTALMPKVVQSGKVNLPPLGVAYVVAPNAGAAACMA